MSDSPHSYLPSEGISYDPSEPIYWDADALQLEVRRVFEVCHGCRMCFKYCDSFPDLFAFIDERDGDVGALTAEHTEHVMEECFQCKLCEVQCPYTPRENHEFKLDFPALVHRYKAQRVQKYGLPLRESVLGDPDATGKAARLSLGMVNMANRNSVHRWFLEKVLGVHREKQLPDFSSYSFESWAKKEELIKDADTAPEAVLFQTCYVEHNEPEVGKDTVSVYQKNGIDLACVKGLKCCGMPAWESGDLDGLRKRAASNLDTLMPYVEQGAKVVALNPTCAMLMRREYPTLLEGADRERATRLADAIRDPSEYLWSIRSEERFNTDFQSTPGDVAYHAPCHLRVQSVGFRGRDLMRKIPGVKPTMTMECCGHDGTYAMKVEGFEPSKRIGNKAFTGLKDADAKVWATDCPLAAIQFEQHAGKKPMHPMSILARAYEKGGFATPVEVEDSE